MLVATSLVAVFLAVSVFVTENEELSLKNRPLRTLSLTIAVCVVALAFGSHLAVAEEGGSGHYFPGSMSDFVDAVPTSPTFIFRYNQLYYSGSVGAHKAIPIAGLTAFGLNATSWGEGLTFLWRPPVDMGKRWSYAMSTTIPFLQLSVSASAAVPIPGLGVKDVSRTGTRDDIGDLIVMPLMFNYNVNPNFNVNFRVAEYLPTGNYGVGRLANTGKNFFTTEPTLGLVYLGTKNGHEADLYIGADFNSENKATQYTTGTQFHLDGTLAQHLPLLKGLAGIGVNSFYYQQVSGDRGPGATLGASRAQLSASAPCCPTLNPRTPRRATWTS